MVSLEERPAATERPCAPLMLYSTHPLGEIALLPAPPQRMKRTLIYVFASREDISLYAFARVHAAKEERNHGAKCRKSNVTNIRLQEEVFKVGELHSSARKTGREY